jgi:hypothetical protein
MLNIVDIVFLNAGFLNAGFLILALQSSVL